MASHDHDHDHHCDHDHDKKEEEEQKKVDPKVVIAEKEKAVVDTISSILESLNKMDTTTQEQLRLVDKEFTDFLQKLENRKNGLKQELTAINLDKKEILNGQLGELQKYQKELQSAKQTDNPDPKIADKNITLKTKPIIKLNINNDQISQDIALMGDINNTFSPRAPQIEITEIKAHTAKIIWSPGTGKYGGYQRATKYIVEIAEGENVIDYNPDSDDKKEKENETEKIDASKLKFSEIKKLENKRFARLSKLKASTNYYIRVKCKNEYGWSSYCDPVKFTTYILKIDTKIMTSDEIEMLINVIKQQRKKKHVRWNLKYRGSEDGFLAKTFHSKCDDVGNTVCVIQSDHGNVFGAFTRLAWKSDVGRYHVDEAAFVFILRKKNKKLSTPKVYLQYTSSQHSVVHNKYMGPVFGYGHDIFIRNKCNEVNDNSCRNHTYQCSYAGELAGEEKFRVINYEVFQIQHDDDIIKEPVVE